ANILLGISILPLLLVRSADWLWLLYLASLVQSALAQFLAPAENALLPRLVAEQDLVPANALNGINNNIARLAGPPLGGLVVAAWDLGGAMLLDAASFFVAAALVARVAVDGHVVRADPAEGSPDRFASTWAGAWVKAWHEWVDGLALVRCDRVVAVIFVFMAISGVGEGVMGALFVPFVTTVLGGDGFAYGTIVAAQAVGGLGGSAVIGQFGRRVSPQRLFAFGAIALGVVDLCIFNAHRVYPGVLPPLILMIVVGLPAACIGIGYTTLVQTAVADEYRGRVLGSLGAVSALSLLIGAALAGTLGNRVGVVSLLTIQAVGYPLSGLIVLVALPPGTSCDGSQSVPRPRAARW
ncbi:MAG: Uncharacterized MFS-type transporter, partial [uncultured Thermomicrobiales bacterium]